MGIPELVVLAGVQRAWDFLKAYPGEILAAEMRELSAKKQQSYREMIEVENPTIHLAYPTSKTTLPAFSVILQSEAEQFNFMDDAGPDDRMLPYPPPAEDEFVDVEPMGGTVYDGDTPPRPLTLSGDAVKDDVRTVRRTQVQKKNLDMQRGFLGGDADEHFAQIGEPSRVWNRNEHLVSSRSWIDQVGIGIMVTTTSAEKTLVYYRLLRTVLRLLATWFSRNGVKNPTYSGSDLQNAESLGPAPSPGAFQRMITMSFAHESTTYEVEAILRGWEIQINLVTPNAEGGVDETPVVMLEGSARPPRGQ